MAIVSVIPWSLGATGYIFGATISDYLVRKRGDAIAARRIVIAIALTGAAISVGLCGAATTATAAVSLMSVGILCLHVANPCFWATVQDSVAPNRVGGVGGFVHFISNTAGIFAPSITGLIVQRTHQFTSAFLIAGGLAIVGAVAVAIFAKPIRDTKPELAAASGHS
jgi:ACS family hexuronate transporter-like MFS transporter